MTRALVFLLLLLPTVLFPQVPSVGDINFYGLRKLSQERVQAVLGVKQGDPLPPSKGDLEEKLETLPGVVLASVTAVCCEGKNAMLFVGIEEKGSAHFALRSEPAGDVILPEGVSDTFRRFLEAVEGAGRRGSTAEDLTAGHSLMTDPTVRAVQLEFVAMASKNEAVLRKVLREGSIPELRAIAATVLGYSPRKAEVVADLQYAMQDPDEAVRANSVRSLTAIAVLAAKQPELEIKVAPTWFVEMLNSIVLSDRLKGAEALVMLTETNRAAVVQLRERALASLVEMARWKSLRYALPAYVLVGRIAGLPESEIQSRWEKGGRESVIEQALHPKQK